MWKHPVSSPVQSCSGACAPHSEWLSEDTICYTGLSDRRHIVLVPSRRQSVLHSSGCYKCSTRWMWCYLLLRDLPLSHIVFVPLLLTVPLLQTLWSFAFLNRCGRPLFIDYRPISRLSVHRLRLLPSCSQRSAEIPFAHLSQTWALAFQGDMIFSGGGDSTDGDCTLTELTVMVHVE